MLQAVVEAVAELLEAADDEVVACGLDHQGESVLAWDAETGAPLSPIVVWQDKRSQEVLDRMGAAEDEIRSLSGLPFDPYFSAAKLAWLLENEEKVQQAREAGTLRMGTVDSFLCDRLGAGFATDNSTASRTQLHRLGTPGFDERLCELFGVPMDVLPEVRDTAGALGTLSHESWPVELPLCGQVVDQQAALAGAGCVVPGRVKATYGTGVFVLGHVGDQVPEPSGGLLPTVAWRIDGRMEYAIDGGVFAAGAMLEWMCRELGMADSPAALTELARDADDNGGARVLPGLAGLGAPWWKPEARAVIAGMHGGTTRANVARAAARGHRVARGRRGGSDARDGGGELAARGRRTHERAAAASAPGGRDRRARGRRGRRRHRARRGRAGRRGLRRDRVAARGGRAAADRPLGRAAAGRRLAHARARTLEGVRARRRLSLARPRPVRRAVGPPRAARPARRSA